MRRLAQVDDALAKAELRIAALLLGAMLAICAVGAVTRSLGQPLVWSDELAILLMVSAALFAASANLAKGVHIQVDILSRRFSEPWRRAGSALLLALLLGFLLCLWRWLDPIGLWRAGSGTALARQTGNFTYTEPTMTLGVAKIWFWLPMVVASLCTTFHMTVQLACGRGRVSC